MEEQPQDPIVESAIRIAERWQKRASELVSDFDRKFFEKMNKMLEHPEDKALLVELMDQCFRSKDPARVANQIVFLLKKHGMASFFSSSEKTLLHFFSHFAALAPSLSVPLFVKQIRNDTRTVVIQGESGNFDKHLEKRKQEGVSNIANLIGEVVLGEEEAQFRMNKYKHALANPNIEFLSIKLSTLYSQMNSLNMEGTLEILVERLSELFQQALDHPRELPDGSTISKFINLDMEEYRDLEITVEVFRRTLDKPEFKQVHAGIALQAYLPDSYVWQKRITEWAIERVKNGGQPIKIRLVKGANMEMEMTESDLRGWEVAPFTDKAHTDANYKRMARYALEPNHAPAVHLGVASHNLFEIAHAVALAEAKDTKEYLTIEMLEGMSESARQAIHEITQPVMLYAPTAGREQFTNAIAYLVRRLDENTGDENFIRYSFGLQVGTQDWEYQKQLFRESFAIISKLPDSPNRSQNRLVDAIDHSTGRATVDCHFQCEADTDFVLSTNRAWAQNIRRSWNYADGKAPIEIPVVVDGEDLFEDRKPVTVLDRSHAPKDVPIAIYRIASEADLKAAVKCAKEDPDGWRKLSVPERSSKLREVAKLIRKRRGDLIGVAAAELGKVITETDVEVSEAVDFLEYYARSAEFWEKNASISGKPKGVGLVVPPWNFPIAIPLGGVAAALAAGNTVILKPASVAVACSYEFCKCFWDAGISKKVLQLSPCPGRLAGEHLVAHPDVDFVILTGGESTAYQMLKTRPDLLLTAETGGKDATIVTALSDRDQAIKNICHSAFSNSGQKCSATSLLVLEREVYESESFKSALVDAASSMPVGSPWDFGNRISLMANPVDGALKQAIDTLEEGESWALEPTFKDGHPYLLTPGIKWGVKEGSFCHMTELFGPILSVMCAEDLNHAIEIVNATGYGLTSGIESLDEREIELWKSKIHAGNLYINRSTTGAIVLRQPFGGLGKSAIGAGRKVGIDNYITQFMDFEDAELTPFEKKHVVLPDWVEHLSQCDLTPEQIDRIKSAWTSYNDAMQTTFSSEKDVFDIRGEANTFRYLPIGRVLIRAGKDCSTENLCLRVLGAIASGTPLDVFFEDAESKAFAFFTTHLTDHDLIGEVAVHSDTAVASRVANYERVIYADTSDIPELVFKACSESVVFVVRQQPLACGRIELLNYFEEQSISHSYHRYGNISGYGKKPN
jgi:RHH-type proline utilization regulon transcriptional repressor/proline dehydrogenase/delta 1-pyrroline-5-carboxylate dehydrogenase